MSAARGFGKGFEFVGNAFNSAMGAMRSKLNARQTMQVASRVAKETSNYSRDVMKFVGEEFVKHETESEAKFHLFDQGPGSAIGTIYRNRAMIGADVLSSAEYAYNMAKGVTDAAADKLASDADEAVEFIKVKLVESGETLVENLAPDTPAGKALRTLARAYQEGSTVINPHNDFCDLNTKIDERY